MELTIRRSKKRIQRIYLIFFSVLAFSAALLACSSGSGGSGGSPGATYTGSTTPAVMTPENSRALVKDSFHGAMTGNSMVPFAAAAEGAQKDSRQAPATPMPLLALQAAFADSLVPVVGAPGDSPAAQRVPMGTSSASIEGQCGGRATYTVSYNESTGAFKGSFNYDGFCAGGITLSGRVTFEGRLVSDSAFEYFSFTFTDLTATANGASSTINGRLDCEFTVPGSDLLITVDMTVTDSTSGKICWINNYDILVSGIEMEISGRYYDQEHGYVDFVTNALLIMSGAGNYPQSGQLTFTGAASAKVRLKALPAPHCQLTADFDGDGLFDDSDTGPIAWEDL